MQLCVENICEDASIHMAGALLLPDSGNKTHITVCHVFECVFKELFTDTMSMELLQHLFCYCFRPFGTPAGHAASVFFDISKTLFFPASRGPTTVLASSPCVL